MLSVSPADWLEYLVKTPDRWIHTLICYLAFQQHCLGAPDHLSSQSLTGRSVPANSMFVATDWIAKWVQSSVIFLGCSSAGGIAQMILAAQPKREPKNKVTEGSGPPPPLWSGGTAVPWASREWCWESLDMWNELVLLVVLMAYGFLPFFNYYFFFSQPRTAKVTW